MKYLWRLTLTALALAAVLGAGFLDRCAAQDAESLIGKKAPALEAGNFALHGEPVRLADLKNKVVLLVFWAPWANTCEATFDTLNKWNRDFGEDLEILAVTTYYQRFRFDPQTHKLQEVVPAAKGVGKLQGGLTVAQEQEMLKEFAAYHKLRFHIMTLPKEAWDAAIKDYHVKWIPKMVVINRKGNVREVAVGCEPDRLQAVQEGIRAALRK
jgi:thiol-disulfide isomerase/thioredoxin